MNTSCCRQERKAGDCWQRGNRGRLGAYVTSPAERIIGECIVAWFMRPHIDRRRFRYRSSREYAIGGARKHLGTGGLLRMQAWWRQKPVQLQRATWQSNSRCIRRTVGIGLAPSRNTRSTTSRLQQLLYRREERPLSLLKSFQTRKDQLRQRFGDPSAWHAAWGKVRTP